MAQFKSAEQILAAKDKAGVPRRRPEIQDETFWREKIVVAREQAQQGKIFGLMSWDPDLRNSFSADPTSDPFALTRTRFPTGKGARLPRRIVYFMPPDTVPIPGPTPGSVTTQSRPWRMVILESQLLYKDLLPQKLVVPGRADPIEAHRAERRMPDDVRTEVWLHKSVGSTIEAKQFRVLPVDPEKLFTGRNQTTALRQAFGGVTILPADGLAQSQRLAFTTTDWNLPLAATPGGGMAQHVLKGRNTHVSIFIGQMQAVGIKFADGAPAIFRHREIYMPYETLISVVTLDPPVLGAGPVVQALDYQSVLRKDPVSGAAAPLLPRVAGTQTRFNEPVAFVTMEVRGEFKTNKVDFIVTEAKLTLPPDSRVIEVVDANGTRRTVTYDPKSGLKALLHDLDVVHKSLVAVLPAQIRQRLQ